MLGCGLVAIIGLTVLSYYNGRACLRRREASFKGRAPANSSAATRGTGSSCWPWRTGPGEDAWTDAEDEDEDGHEAGYEINLTDAKDEDAYEAGYEINLPREKIQPVSPAGIGDALALDGLDRAAKRKNWAKVASDETQAAAERQELSYSRAAAHEALSSAAAISHGKGRSPGETVGAVGRGPDGLLTTPNSQWFGMKGSDPDDGVPFVSAGPKLTSFRPEREQGFGFSASTSAAGAGAMPAIHTRRRSSDVSVSVAPGPGTPQRGTLQQTQLDYDGANVTERRSTVNLTAIERAQEARRRQINGHHASMMSMASRPPSTVAATGHDDNRVDAAQRKAALQRERLASAVAWEDDRRRARMKSVGANQAPIMRSNRDADAELRATNDHVHRIRAAASMKRFGAPPSYGAAPAFDGSSPPAAPNRYSTPGDYASAADFVLDDATSSIRPKSVRRSNPLFATDEHGKNNSLPSPPPSPATSGSVVVTLSPGRYEPIAAGDELPAAPPPPPPEPVGQGASLFSISE